MDVVIKTCDNGSLTVNDWKVTHTLQPRHAPLWNTLVDCQTVSPISIFGQSKLERRSFWKIPTRRQLIKRPLGARRWLGTFSIFLGFIELIDWNLRPKLRLLFASQNACCCNVHVSRAVLKLFRPCRQWKSWMSSCRTRSGANHFWNLERCWPPRPASVGTLSKNMTARDRSGQFVKTCCCTHTNIFVQGHFLRHQDHSMSMLMIKDLQSDETIDVHSLLFLLQYLTWT